MSQVLDSLRKLPFGVEVPDGRYVVKSFESFEQGDVVAEDGKVVVNDWLGFYTGPLAENLIQKIRHLQLITESKDKATAKDPPEGNWCWFELGIVRQASGETAAEKEPLCWMSHENAFMSEAYEWPGDRIQVRVCARFKDWGISAKKGYLVFDIGAADAATPTRDAVLLPSHGPGDRELLIAQNDAVNDQFSVDTILEDVSSRLRIKCVSLPPPEPNGSTSAAARLVDNLQEYCEQHPSLLVSNEPPPLEGSTINLPDIPSGFPAKRLLVVLSSEAMVQGKPHLSWDQTVEEFWKLGDKQLNRPYHLLVRFGHEGAIYRDPAHPNDSVLIFEPGSRAGGFLDKWRSECTEGLNETLETELDTVFTAGLASSLAKESDLSIRNLCETQIKQAIITGLEWYNLTWNNVMLGTPADPVFIPGSSSLIFRTLPYDPSSTEAATEIALKPIANETAKDDLLPHVPTASFGALLTADRSEIDSFREIAHKLKGYLSKKDFSKPFSIAVFGRPGSGKSFGVDQVIRSIIGEAEMKRNPPLNRNLSQFENEDDITSVFAKIESMSQENRTAPPVVFFDEFDATHQKEHLYWLKHIRKRLQPDHGYQDNKNRGHGIYVFIGGTAETFEEFQLQPSRRVNQSPPQAGKDGYPASCQHLKPVMDDIFRDTKLVPKELRFKTETQETTSEDLSTVFHWVRNPGVSDADKRKESSILDKPASDLPIVFFDNFGENRAGDTLGWLKSFLAPMQDGEFRDTGDKVYELGHAIFVFIEGNMGHFESFLDNPDMPDVFKHAKGPDFVSRLSGQVMNGSVTAGRGDAGNARDDEKAQPDHLRQVLTGYRKKLADYEKQVAEYNDWVEKGKTGQQKKEPKPLKPLSIGVFRTDETTRKQFAGLLDGHINIQGPNKVNDGDDMFVIRRAIMLRYMLNKRGLQGMFEPGSDVLRALLRVPRLRHGARSLETILAMSRIPGEGEQGTTGGQKYFQRVHLPKDSQLKLHVDLKSWRKYLDRSPPAAGQNQSPGKKEAQGKGKDGEGLDDAQKRHRRAEIQWIVLRRGGGYRKEDLF
ncbi:hypothetical protein QBC47DRAFT_451791 [Echria macrotheca]|uniref:ATPase AAA-type core domain-containing protein n=1 Tax=Echria macrotheca TaxID=438768 RepID=A0AAJ0BHZ9_9PEZI|nr:hypothetical protein QBC47DRAFT_451791 [Echria macrotheca]